MDLNNSFALVSCNRELNINSNTALSLDCFSYGGKEKSQHAGPLDDACRLVLGLGPTPSVYSDDYFPVSKKPSGSIMGLSCEDDSVLKLGLYDHCVTSIGNMNSNASCFSHNGSNMLEITIDKGSTSAKNVVEPGENAYPGPHLSSETSVVTNYSMGTIFDHQTSNSKNCKYDTCTKGARGATPFCTGHGGGQRCNKPGCNKGAERRSVYCKAHGGGRRCQHLGCTKSAEGTTEYCIAHGGGRRCGHSDGCSKAARGKTGLCIKHGGGKRCKVDGCTRSAEGHVGLCVSHGGGRRCQFQGCNKGAQGSTMYCKVHGGGKRCVFAGCTKGAEGNTPFCKAHGGGKRCVFNGGGICPKSVHGGTNFCVAHGGGKRCSVAGCTKSARGRTDCCVKHGGGKRCKTEKCTKSAQGSTGFCKAHGGGKRCKWGGDAKCEKFARGKSGLCAAHTSMVQESGNFKIGTGPGLFNGLVPAPASATTVVRTFENVFSSSGVSTVSDSTDSLERPAKRQLHVIPHQVLVPSSMKSAFSSYAMQVNSEYCGEQGGDNGDSHKRLECAFPEGRVYGGRVRSLLGGNLQTATVDGVI